MINFITILYIFDNSYSQFSFIFESCMVISYTLISQLSYYLDVLSSALLLLLSYYLYSLSFLNECYFL